MKHTIGRICVMAMASLSLCGCMTPESMYSRAQNKDSVSSYRDFLARYPDSPTADRARRRLEELQWAEAKKAESLQALQSFLQDYPEGRFLADAHTRLEELRWEKARETESLSACEEYLQDYSRGRFVPEARLLLQRLREEKALAAEFRGKLDKAESIDQVKELIGEYSPYKFAGGGLPKLERLLIQEIKKRDADECFVIDDLFYSPGVRPSNVSIAVDPVTDTIVFLEKSTFVFKQGRYDLFGDQSIHRFVGEVQLFGVTFLDKGEELNPLTFFVDRNLGYVYLRGKGRVIIEGKDPVDLGYCLIAVEPEDARTPE